MASDGTYIYVGGDFLVVGGNPLEHLARIPIAGAGDPDLSWVFNADGDVAALSLDASNTLYVGGSFININGTPSPGIARILATPALDPGFGTAVDLDIPIIFKVMAYGPDIFMSGNQTYSGKTYVGSVFGVTASGALGWFQPGMSGGEAHSKRGGRRRPDIRGGGLLRDQLRGGPRRTGGLLHPRAPRVDPTASPQHQVPKPQRPGGGPRPDDPAVGPEWSRAQTTTRPATRPRERTKSYR